MLQQAIDYCIDRVRENLAELTSYPEYTEKGCWHCVNDGGWVGGHWVGLMWLAYAHTRDESFARAAREWAACLAPRQDDPTTHDLGFLFELSHVLGARLTENATLKAPALAAAKTLARRFNKRGGFLPAWSSQTGRAIIDTMMNLNLLYWASVETGDPMYASIATAHAETALARQVRLDGSTAHVADFDPETGEFLKQDTHQGLSATSCWSRGQAWAVYGFANCYGKTGAVVFLGTARRLANYALHHLPSDGVPYWDYDSPLTESANDSRDSSAAAILAGGLLRLALVEPDETVRMQWRAQATRIVESLWQNYSSRGTAEPSILLHGTRNKPRGFADQGLIYGDYYFLETLMRLSEAERLPQP